MHPKLKIGLTAAAITIGLAYPFLVYFGLNTVKPEILIGVVLVLLGVRVLILRRTMPSKNRLIWPAIAAIIFMIAAAFFKASIAVKLYPVGISLMLAAAFLYSVMSPPTAIELIARITEPDLDEKGVQYTRNVTIVWILFFVFNSVVATWTVLYGTVEQWTLYNGLISYCLTGLLFAGEFLVRRTVRAKG
ncbi:MAG: hypothetical protein V7727_20025 [Sneathiella sp.]